MTLDLVLSPPLAVLDTPLCAYCRAPTRFICREPNPKLGPKFELDTFECRSCNHLHTRDVGPNA
jgi:hypothetical protein